MSHREQVLKEKLRRFDQKLNKPARYFSVIIDETNRKTQNFKTVKEKAKDILKERRLEQSKVGMTKLKKQINMLESEIDQVKMPIIELFKTTILKQRENAYKRTIKGQIDRNIQEDIMLPVLCK